ncbi:MAG: TIGR00300 family protein [Candidatus Micrarchaeota archaeon]
MAPDGFFVTTNRATEVLVGGEWLSVRRHRMDGVVVLDNGVPICKMPRELMEGEIVLLKSTGIRERTSKETGVGEFGFFSSSLSPERNIKVDARAVARDMIDVREKGKSILFVCGPALVHCGGRDYLASLVRAGWVDMLFTGNALPIHDMEASMFGTSLGISLNDGSCGCDGHSNHARALNKIVDVGGISNAVNSGMVRDGVMYELVKRNVRFVIAGSIRDDGPLPETIRDVYAAQDEMRMLIEGVGLCVIVATTLHGIAVGNMLPEDVGIVCVDNSLSVAGKLIDRGSGQAQGIVSSASEFLRALAESLEKEINDGRV